MASKVLMRRISMVQQEEEDLTVVEAVKEAVRAVQAGDVHPHREAIAILDSFQATHHPSK